MVRVNVFCDVGCGYCYCGVCIDFVRGEYFVGDLNWLYQWEIFKWVCQFCNDWMLRFLCSKDLMFCIVVVVVWIVVMQGMLWVIVVVWIS